MRQHAFPRVEAILGDPALHWDDVTGRDRGALLMVDPPLVESSIGLYVESLFWERSFGKCIRDIGPENEQVLSGSNSIK